MRWLLFFVALPFFTAAQTVHVEDNRIVYKGTFKLEQMNKADVYARATMTITHYVNDKIGPEHVTRETSIVTAGSMSLSSPYHLIRTLHYIIELNAGDGQCQYSIDSVYITEKERGGPTQEFSSEEILKRMDISGPVAANAEKQLNEIDMNFQKLIDLIGADMKRTPLNN